MHFGFDAIRSALGSDVGFRQLSVYELSRVIQEQFDYVVFWGVLYHLRHPLLALDNVRAVTSQTAYVETAVGCARQNCPNTRRPLWSGFTGALSLEATAATGLHRTSARYSTGVDLAAWSRPLSMPGHRKRRPERW